MSRARVVAHYLAARRRRFTDREHLEAWQRARLRRVVAAAPRRYPFYAGLSPRTLDDLPVLDKATMVDRFSDLNRVGLTLDQALDAARTAERHRDFSTTLRGVSVGLSSGTSGRQSAFLTSAAERDRWAGQVLATVMPDGVPRGTRVALVLRAGGPLYQTVDGGRVSFTFVDLADHARILGSLAEARPTVVVAPPSVLVMAARAGLPISPRQVVSVAEVLDPHDAALVEAALGVPVSQVYQATEGFLGASCREGQLHLAEDVVHIEPLWVGEGRFVPVVTDLWRTTQAMLRVRLDDVLVVGTPCECGSPLRTVAEVVGRCDDVLWLPRADDPATLAPFFADFVRGAALGAGVDDFRVLQLPDRWELATRPESAWPVAAAALREATAQAGCVPPPLVQAAWPDDDPTRKLRRVRRAAGVAEGVLRQAV
ncbi:MAG: hypothetical protein FWD18_00180 [Micrococcales bacterium]|nr:hypothetical protein [Micrococcales bacterium]